MVKIYIYSYIYLYAFILCINIIVDYSAAITVTDIFVDGGINNTSHTVHLLTQPVYAENRVENVSFKGHTSTVKWKEIKDKCLSRYCYLIWALLLWYVQECISFSLYFKNYTHSFSLLHKFIKILQRQSTVNSIQAVAYLYPFYFPLLIHSGYCDWIKSHLLNILIISILKR